jgi:hypothetical protein
VRHSLFHRVALSHHALRKAGKAAVPGTKLDVSDAVGLLWRGMCDRHNHVQHQIGSCFDVDLKSRKLRAARVAGMVRDAKGVRLVVPERDRFWVSWA